MCRSDCRTILWGGAGQPEYDAQGSCSCICEDESWSDRNIYGRASCVPHAAHKTFGWVGLGISVGVLCHAVYHLRLQLKFHERLVSASSSPVEKCRRQLHMQTVITAVITMFYFLLVLGDALRWCPAVVLLAGAPAYPGTTVSTARMWMYTNDPRLMRESPRALALSNWLERPLGNIVACCGAAIVPVVAAVLALADFTETAAQLFVAGGLAVAMVTMVIFVIFGRALLMAIDKSLQNQEKQRQQQQTSSASGGSEAVEGRSGSQTLSEAKRKVKNIVLLEAIMISSSCLFVLPVMITNLDVEVPLVMFGVPLSYMPLMWLAFNIQIHGGRSGSDGRPVSPKPTGLLKLFSSSNHQEQQVVPAEVP